MLDRDYLKFTVRWQVSLTHTCMANSVVSIHVYSTALTHLLYMENLSRVYLHVHVYWFSILADQKYDIDACLKQIDSCFNLIIPRLDDTEERQLPFGEVASPQPSSHQTECKDRTLSSGSFASLGSMEGSDNEVNCGEPQAEGSRSMTLEHSGNSLNSEVEKENYSQRPHSDAQEDREMGEDQTDFSGEQVPLAPAESDDPFDLAPPSCASGLDSELISVYGRVREGGKKGVRLSSKGKGKGKESREREELVAVAAEENKESSSNESDVEWEEVEPVNPSSSLLALQQHGYTGQEINIPISLPTKVSSHNNY